MNETTIINTKKGIPIGDSFCLGIEFKSRPWILENVHFDQFVNVWKGGKNNILPGYYSDDTEHSIGVTEALLDEREFTEELLLEKFKNEYETDLKAKGHHRDGHGSIEKWYLGLETIEEIRRKQASREDPGNAPVMRAVPIAFAPVQDQKRYSDINANATHPHRLARAGSYLTVLCARHLLNGNPKENLIKTLLSSDIDPAIRLEVSTIFRMPSPNELTHSDYLFLHGKQPLPHISWDDNIYGMPCACFKTALNVVYVLHHANNAFEALKYSARMGGDVDSLAAVCTGIASGAYGLDSLPKFMLDQTEGLERMETLGTKIYEKFHRETSVEQNL